MVYTFSSEPKTLEAHTFMPPRVHAPLACIQGSELEEIFLEVDGVARLELVPSLQTVMKHTWCRPGPVPLVTP